jgi:hypothetical protein
MLSPIYHHLDHPLLARCQADLSEGGDERVTEQRKWSPPVVRVLERSKTDVPFRVVYHASDTRHGLFADFRKILEWCWLADEMGNLDIELSYRKYDPDEMDVEGFLANVGVNSPGYDRQRDGERVREKFYVGINPLKYFFGLHMPEKHKSYQHTFHVHNARVSDDGELLTQVGVSPGSPLRRELQNSPEPYYASATNSALRRRAHQQLQRCVSLRPQTREKIDAIHRRNLAGAGHVIGVHVRFSRHYEALHLRPGCDFNESIIEDIDDWIRQNGHDNSTIFLATHLEDLVQLAARKWAGRTFATEIARAQSDEDFYFVDEDLATQVEGAIIDCWLLSTCDVLLGGVSNLAYTAMILNPELPFHFLDSLAGSRGG